MKKVLSSEGEERVSVGRQSSSYLAPAWPWVVILGVDGSGKSSVLQSLAARFEAAPVAGVKIVHRRPGVVYSARDGGSGAVAHYSKPAHGKVKSTLKLAAMILDWLFGYWSQLAYRRAKGYLLFSDRHSLLDLLVDPLRYRYSGPSWMVRLALRCVPMPDLVLLLDAPVHVLQARKHELAPEEATRQRNAYLELMATLPNSTIIDVARPLNQVVADVEQSILDFIKFSRVRSR
jgi:thymidylate kinase